MDYVSYYYTDIRITVCLMYSYWLKEKSNVTLPISFNSLTHNNHRNC